MFSSLDKKSQIYDDSLQFSLNNILEEKNIFFRNLVIAVWVILAFYSVFYAVLQFWLSCSSVLLGAVVLSPLTLFLDKRGYASFVRIFLLISCNFYIYITSLGLKHLVHAEYYCIPATMLALLVFDQNEKKKIAFGILLPLVTWFLIQVFGYDFVPSGWLVNTPWVTYLQIANFIGSFVISIVFLNIFMKSIIRMKELAIHENSEKNRELEKTYQLLKKSMDSLNEAQKISKLGSWSFDLSSQKISWSKQMFDIFPSDISKGEPTYEEHCKTIHPEDFEMWEKNVNDCILNGRRFSMRFRTYKKEDPQQVVWVLSNGQATLGQDGKPIGLLGTCQDISEQVEAQRIITEERAKSLQSAKLATLGEMAAGIAHEINNPLAIIAGSVDILLRESNENPTRSQERLETVKKSVGRISKIITGLRKFSRTSGNDSERKLCSLNNLLNEVIILTQGKTKRFGVKVEIVVPEKAVIFCDEVEIEQVFVNLINNAVDAIHAKKERWIKISAEEDTMHRCVIRVTDSGEGISKKVADKLFEPFFTTKQIGEGTGLGLSISKGIIESHGGTLEICTTSTNTCFEMKLPVTAKQQRADDTAA